MVDSASKTVSVRLAEWATTCRVADLPSDVTVYAKRLILDSLGLQIRGSTLRHVQPQRRLVERSCSLPEATITGTGVRTTTSSAAYVNGTFAASMEFDDCHMLPWHAGSIMVPTSLAVVEANGGPGEDVLLGTVVGHQVVSLLGTVVSRPLLARGWHAPRAMGPFGAAAATAAILRATPTTLANAFGIAAGDASGPMEYDRTGGEVKRQYTGSAARAGIEAVQLASDGVTGPLTIFEGPSGLFRLMADVSDVAAMDAEWDKWHIVDTFFRLNPGVGTVLPALQVVSDIMAEHPIDWRRITAINVGLPPFAVGHGGHITQPTDSLGAHFSLTFALALRLITGGSAPANYLDPQLWVDPDVRAVGSKVRPYAMEFASDAPLLSADVRIIMDNGRSYGGLQYGFRGHTSQPATDEDIEAKFRANADGVIPEASIDEVICLVRDIENLSDIRTLTKLLGPV